MLDTISTDSLEQPQVAHVNSVKLNSLVLNKLPRQLRTKQETAQSTTQHQAQIQMDTRHAQLKLTGVMEQQHQLTHLHQILHSPQQAAVEAEVELAMILASHQSAQTSFQTLVQSLEVKQLQFTVQTSHLFLLTTILPLMELNVLLLKQLTHMSNV